MTKKILLSLIVCSLVLGLSAIAVSAQSSNAVTGKAKTVKYDGTCMQTAVSKRDTAIVTAYTKYSTAILSALNTRITELKAGWALSDVTQRRAALKAAWSKYNKARIAARNTWVKEKNAAWTQFNTDRKACKVNYYDDTTSQTTTDNNL